jgi:hypothetical protein
MKTHASVQLFHGENKVSVHAENVVFASFFTGVNTIRQFTTPQLIFRQHDHSPTDNSTP